MQDLTCVEALDTILYLASYPNQLRDELFAQLVDDIDELKAENLYTQNYGVTLPDLLAQLGTEGWETALTQCLNILDDAPDVRSRFFAIEDEEQREARFREAFGEWRSGEGGPSERQAEQSADAITHSGACVVTSPEKW